MITLNGSGFNVLDTVGQAQSGQSVQTARLKQLANDAVRFLQAPFDDQDAAALLRERLCDTTSCHAGAYDEDVVHLRSVGDFGVRERHCAFAPRFPCTLCSWWGSRRRKNWVIMDVGACGVRELGEHRNKLHKRESES